MMLVKAISQVRGGRRPSTLGLHHSPTWFLLVAACTHLHRPDFRSLLKSFFLLYVCTASVSLVYKKQMTS